SVQNCMIFAAHRDADATLRVNRHDRAHELNRAYFFLLMSMSGNMRMVDVPFATMSPAALRRLPSTNMVERPRRSIHASATSLPGVAGAKKLTLISSDMGVCSKLVTHMAARAMAASIQPVTKPPCTTPPE